MFFLRKRNHFFPSENHGGFKAKSVSSCLAENGVSQFCWKTTMCWPDSSRDPIRNTFQFWPRWNCTIITAKAVLERKWRKLGLLKNRIKVCSVVHKNLTQSQQVEHSSQTEDQNRFSAQWLVPGSEDSFVPPGGKEALWFSIRRKVSFSRWRWTPPTQNRSGAKC